VRNAIAAVTKKRIWQSTGCLAILVAVVSVRPVVLDPTLGHWIFFVGSIVVFSFVFYWVLIGIAKLKLGKDKSNHP